MIQFTAKELSLLLQGEVEGNPDVCVSTFTKIEEGVPGSLSFLANLKYLKYLYTTQASIVIVNKDLLLTDKVNCTLIRVDDAYSAFAILLAKYNELTQSKVGIEQPSFISESATIGINNYVGAFVYIGKNVKIGINVKLYPHVYIGDNAQIDDNTVLYSGVKIYSNCIIGKNVMVHAGAVIGSDGFGFAPQIDGSYSKITQIGNVVIQDNVEIGANTTIDRATMGSTIIHKGAKLDNLIQIAHNVEIGQNTVIASQTGISGSTKVGKQCVIAGQVGITGHLTIADYSTVEAQSGVQRNIKEEGKKWNGSPIDEYIPSLKSARLHQQLPKLEQRISDLENRIKNILI